MGECLLLHADVAKAEGALRGVQHSRGLQQLRRVPATIKTHRTTDDERLPMKTRAPAASRVEVDARVVVDDDGDAVAGYGATAVRYLMNNGVMQQRTRAQRRL